MDGSEERNRIRVLIADDHGVVREGLRALICSEPGLELVGEAEDGAEAIHLTLDRKPDVLLLDMVMPVKDGLEVIQAVKKAGMGVRILVLTSFADDERVFPAIKAGADGYLLKNTPPKMLLNAVRAVYQGEASMSPSIASKLMREIQRPPKPLEQEPLTERELDVLRLIAQGLSNNEIAEQLYLTEGTVRLHVSNLLGKLHLANRTQAALYALREGLAKL